MTTDALEKVAGIEAKQSGFGTLTRSRITSGTIQKYPLLFAGNPGYVLSGQTRRWCFSQNKLVRTSSGFSQLTTKKGAWRLFCFYQNFGLGPRSLVSCPPSRFIRDLYRKANISLSTRRPFSKSSLFGVTSQVDAFPSVLGKNSLRNFS